MRSSSIACSKARHRSRSLTHIAWPQQLKGPGSLQIVVGTLANADAESDERDAVTFRKHLADALAEQFRRAIRVDRRRLHRRCQCATAEEMADDGRSTRA